MGDAFSKVCKVFGIGKLNKHQEDSINYVVENEKDIFVNLPTGLSKLLIYQALPIVFLSVQSTCEKYIVVGVQFCMLVLWQLFRFIGSDSLQDFRQRLINVICEGI